MVVNSPKEWGLETEIRITWIYNFMKLDARDN